MTEENIPPVLNHPPELSAPPIAIPPLLPKWRYASACALLLAYVLGLGLLSARATETISQAAADSTLLPPTVRGLLNLAATEMALFGLVFLAALLLAKFKPGELFLKWTGGFAPIWRGLGWSLLLRGVIAVLMTIAAVGITRGDKNATESLEVLRPKSEAIINPEALNDPLYLLLSFTLISFVVAGFREELWRAGVMASLKNLWPGAFGSKKGQLRAVVIAAIVFGLGHLPQGPAGAIVTGILGLGLGLMIIRYQSIWEAVLAHGFFNATTFLALYYISQNPHLIPK